ncbi:MAG: hypothetical protein QOJ44_1576 [Acidimicrobiaceae bacterium]|nr:hypothetical protein [Acidimicrobiaceae bacterium]
MPTSSGPSPPHSEVTVSGAPGGTGEPAGDAFERLAEELSAESGSRAQRNLYRSMLATVRELAHEDTDVIDLKIADAALAEMSEAFRVFRPYRAIKKMTVFGSARTAPDDPAYAHTRELARSMAEAGWMVVTGAGPGIMAAGMEGAGTDRSIGVNIRLPFEGGANTFIAQDPKLVEMRYFFTRKLMLIKESDGYAVLPGGFGTLDEAFELLTLLQTGKAAPAPVVLLDIPGGNYWTEWDQFVERAVASRGLISIDDRSLFIITDDIGAATDELTGFYRNYQSSRWVGDLLVLRLLVAPSASELAELNGRFGDVLAGGVIRHTKPLPPERAGNDHLDQPRLALRFDKFHYGRLRQLIDAVNQCRGDRS